MARKRVPLVTYGGTSDVKTEVGIVPVPAMSGVTLEALTSTSLRLTDAVPQTSLSLRAIRRTIALPDQPALASFDDPVDSTGRTFSDLTANTVYVATVAAVDTSNRVGPAISTSKATPALVSSSVLLDEQFAGTFSLTDDNNGAHPVWRCEPGDPTVYIKDGVCKITSTGSTGARQISVGRYGGVGKSTLITARGRCTLLDSEDTINGTIPGLKLGLKYRCPDSLFPEEDWQSVRGYDNASPGSFIFLTGIGSRGRLQLPRNRACVSGYESEFYTRDIGYTLNEWRDRSILHQHVGTSSTDPTFRIRYWDNLTQGGSPIFDHTVTHPTIQVKPAYLWMRTDRCNGEWDHIKVEDVT